MRAEQIEHAIQVIRGQRVMLDADLAPVRNHDQSTQLGGQDKRRTVPGRLCVSAFGTRG